MKPHVIVLDDDPTGTQTSAEAPFITRWHDDDIDWLLSQPAPVAFVLTNSRAKPEADADALNRTIGAAISARTAHHEHPPMVVSRSDSTLRGHFPLETDALIESLDWPIRGVVIAPFFAEAGRVTVGGVHFVEEDGRRVPVGDTPFASDRTFGYRSSNLTEWVVEKGAGNIEPSSIALLDLETIRDGVDAVLARLASVGGGYVVVDAEHYDDLGTVAEAFRRLHSNGEYWIFRSAASLVPLLAGESPARPIPPAPDGTQGGGLVIVGSHVPLTSRQLEHLLAAESAGSLAVEIDAERLAADDHPYIASISAHVSATIVAGLLPIAYTTRVLIDAGDPAEALRIARAVNEGICAVVEQLTTRPSWMIAKGGITSHSIAADALRSTRGRVIGPIAPGVPQWELGGTSTMPGLRYVVFPGNVGSDSTLTDVVEMLQGTNTRAT